MKLQGYSSEEVIYKVMQENLVANWSDKNPGKLITALVDGWTVKKNLSGLSEQKKDNILLMY